MQVKFNKFAAFEDKYFIMIISIYGILNLVNRKIYIGSTKNFKARKYSHFFKLKKGQHGNEYLQRSYNKYGKHNFHVFLIEECDENDRYKKEVYFISKYKSYNKNYGYNIYEPDGEKFKCSDKTKEKLINKNLLIGRSVEIDCYYTKDLTFYKTYKSASICARDLGFRNSSVVFNILNGKYNRLSYKGFTFFRKGEQPFLRKSSKQRDMSKYRK
jgi:hypothetical protein